MMSSLFLVMLASVAPATEATPAIRTTTTVNVLVTDRHGRPLPSARVVVNESEHEGVTNFAGRVVFTNVKTGSYTLRVERATFITFEKGFVVHDEKGPYLVVAAVSPLSSLPARRSKGSASARPAALPANHGLTADAQPARAR